MPVDKQHSRSLKKDIAAKLSPEKHELANMVLKWSHMVDDSTKKEESDELFRKIWEMKHGRIDPL